MESKKMVETVQREYPAVGKSLVDVRAELNSHLLHGSRSAIGLEVFEAEVDFYAGRYEIIVTYAGVWNKQSATQLHEFIIDLECLEGADVEVFGVARQRGRRQRNPRNFVA